MRRRFILITLAAGLLTITAATGCRLQLDASSKPSPSGAVVSPATPPTVEITGLIKAPPVVRAPIRDATIDARIRSIVSESAAAVTELRKREKDLQARIQRHDVTHQMKQTSESLDPSQRVEARTKFGMGFKLRQDGWKAAAIQAFREGLNLDPADVKAHFQLAEMLPPAEAYRHYDYVVKLSPDSGEALRAKSWIADNSQYRSATDFPTWAKNPDIAKLSSLPLTFRDCAECPDLVVVPPGAFAMGDLQGGGEAYEQLVHRVIIEKPFAAGSYAITVGEFAHFVAATGHKDAGDCLVKSKNGNWFRQADGNWRNTGFSQSKRHPVVCVSWQDAKAYVQWLNSRVSGAPYRLLREAEWEYAARAGTVTKYWWGDEIGKNRANCDDCGSPLGGQQTMPVGSYSANEFGLWDVHGNVWEWVEDCWSDSYVSSSMVNKLHKVESCKRYVLRGGSWNLGAKYLRAAYRLGDRPLNWDSDYGFRVARSL